MMQNIKIQRHYLALEQVVETWIAKHAGTLGDSFKDYCNCVATRANTQAQDNIVSLASNTDITLTGTFTVGSDKSVTATSPSAGRVDEQLEIGDVILNQTTSELAIVSAVTNSSSFTASQNTDASMTSKVHTISITRLKDLHFSEPSRNMMGVVDGTAGGKTLSGTNTRFTIQLHVGDILTMNDGTGDIRRRIVTITSDTLVCS